MLSVLDIFIIGHDQKLIVDFNFNIQKSHLKQLDYYFILCGEYPDKSLIEKYPSISDKVFYPHRVMGNIEKNKTLLTFTAWHFLRICPEIEYVLHDYVGLFEYDVILKKDFIDLLPKLDPKKIIHFIPQRLDDDLFLKKTPGLIEAIDKVYKTDIKSIINRYYQENEDYFWGATTNCILPIGMMNEFVDWYTPLIPEILKYPNHAHFHERALKIFSILKGYTNVYYPEYLEHKQLNSHKIEL